MYFPDQISELRPVQKFSLDPYFQISKRRTDLSVSNFHIFLRRVNQKETDMGISSAYI
jgi:hypothetical protein